MFPDAELPLAGREAAVLSGVVESYLATGAPVGSHLLAEQFLPRTSSATIRHVLCELEQRGLLIQPHTSAGRLPTAPAIRWWLQRLEAPVPLPEPAESRRFEQELREASDDSTLWRRTSDFLAALTRQVGLVAVLPWRDAGLRHLRFFRLTGRRVLAILVATDGQVRERVGRVPEAYTQAELDAASAYFNHHFAGATLTRIRHELVHRLEEERAAYDELLKRVVVLSHCGVLAMQDGGEVYVQGANHLAPILDADRLAGMLAQLQEKERWLRLLAGWEEPGTASAPAADQTMVEWDSDDGHGGRCWLRVRVGLENEAMPGLSLIIANYGAGAMGILGPTRMEYPRALGAVALARAVCQRVLGESAI